MVVNTNVSSLTAQESTTATNNALSESLEKLSSGLKINKAADDASGLAIADKLRTQATSINQAVDNGNSAVALLQIADKAMEEQSTILDTIKAKLIQANTDTTSEDGRDAIAKDIAKLLEQLDNIAEQTNYNGTYLLADVGDSGTLNGAAGALNFQIGEKETDMITTASINATVDGLSLTDLSDAVNLVVDGTAGAFTMDMAASMQSYIDDAITTLNAYRADIGSTQNQVESAVTNLMTAATNITSAESVIRDVDYAEESANYSKLNIISQAGTYAISQANSVQQNVLSLLQ